MKKINLDLVANTCNPAPLEAEAEGSQENSLLNIGTVKHTYCHTKKEISVM